MAVSEETICKRLSSLNTSQDSIQTASLWILHYKDTAIDKVAKCWMDVYKNADDKLRTALIYVMNDVVQTVGKKDRSDTVKMAFHPHVVNACGLASDSVKRAIIRCVDVFAERRVFPAHIVEEMRAALGVSKKSRKSSADFEDAFSDVDYSTVIRNIESYSQNEELTEKARNILERSDFNFKEKMQERMKDRTEGTKILKEMDESKNKLVQFLNSVERHQNKCKRLTEFLKAAKTSLNLQLRDVTIVDDAYEKFENGILETRKQLKIKLDSGVLMANQSPPRDAPSPLPTDDPFNVEGGSGDDMEMDEDEYNPSNTSGISIAASAPFSNKSVSNTTDVFTSVASSSVSGTSALDPRLQRLLNKSQRQVSTSLNKTEKREIHAAISASMTVPVTASPVSGDPRRRSQDSLLEQNSQHSNGSDATRRIKGSPVTPNSLSNASGNSSASSQIFSPSTGMKTMNINASNPPPFYQQTTSGTAHLSIAPNIPPPIMFPPPMHAQHFSYPPPPNASSIMSYLPPPHLLPPPPQQQHASVMALPPPLNYTTPPPISPMPTGAVAQPNFNNGSSPQKRSMKRKFPLNS